MEKKQQDPNGYQIGDKVRIRSGPNRGIRGTIHSMLQETVQIQLQTGELIQLLPEDITNYSLAARRAWEVMPKQAGRPRLPIPRKKMVSLRLDIDVWKMLGEAAEFNLIPSREQAVNDWLRERLMRLLNSSLRGKAEELYPPSELDRLSFEEALFEGDNLRSARGGDNAHDPTS